MKFFENHFYPFNLKKNGIFKAPCPDNYRGKYTKFNYTESELLDLYVKEVADIITDIKKKGRGLAGFIAESFLSCGGQIFPPEKYFQRVYE